MFLKILTSISLYTILLIGLSANAMAPLEPKTKFDAAQYEKVGDVVLPNEIELPTVFKIDKSKNNIGEGEYGLVVDQNNELATLYTRFQKEDNSQPNVQSTIKSLSPTKEYIGFINDAIPNTFTEFDLDKDGGKASFEYNFGKISNLENVSFQLAAGVANPEMIEVLAEKNGEKFTIISKSRFLNGDNFPPVKVDKIIINLYHSQVLRISEMFVTTGFGFDKTEAQQNYYFLAKPGSQYKAYLSGGRIPSSYETLPDNLGYEIKEVSIPRFINNIPFTTKDTDKDGVLDQVDNCITVENADQADLDKNSRGDKCEDRDLDGVWDYKDNCTKSSNPDQKDTDKDGTGDVCDIDDSRLFQTFFSNNSWALPVIISVCSILVIGVFAARLKKIGE
jgi:Thrombospondin type 3 repeat